MGHLGDLTTQCIRCGFCLESCPTFVETGDETESPRGRIYLVRSVEEGKLSWDDARAHLDLCLGCRACETACPSGVQYGEILELAREKLPRRSGVKQLLHGLTDPGRASLQFKLAGLLPGRKVPPFVQRMLSDEPAEAAIPKPMKPVAFPPLDESKLPPIKGEVALLLGCVMRVLHDPVHQATKRLLRRVGYRTIEIQAPCCGSLHFHSGQIEKGLASARSLANSVPSGFPVIVDSAGCGSAMKEYGKFDAELDPLAKRVFDASEFLHREGLAAVLAQLSSKAQRVTYHDACHLAHGQRITQQPRELLRAIPGLDLVELEEADRCCGSAGIYNVVQPGMARRLLDRKWEFIRATGAQTVVTGNPGCYEWIEQASREQGHPINVVHTMSFLENQFNP